MESMRFKVGDRVRIKSLDWYNENKDEFGVVLIENGEYLFFESDTIWCGKVVTIADVCLDEYYTIVEDFGLHRWTDGMIEGLVEEEKVSNVNSITQDRVDKLACKIDEELPSGNQYEWECPEGYIFKDENGNVINATKLVLEKKKKEYPKSYEECLSVLEIYNGLPDVEIYNAKPSECKLFETLIRLKRCRDAYWKIAGEEMGLGKPWEPDWLDDDTKKYVITSSKVFETFGGLGYINYILTFPTEEMRDAFYENFKSEIEICKKLL